MKKNKKMKKINEKIRVRNALKTCQNVAQYQHLFPEL